MPKERGKGYDDKDNDWYQPAGGEVADVLGERKEMLQRESRSASSRQLGKEKGAHLDDLAMVDGYYHRENNDNGENKPAN
jgi:hypothetical protein